MVRAHLYFVNLKTLQSNKWFFIKELSLFLASWKSVFVGFSHTLRWSILKLYSIFFTGVKFLIHARQSSELFLYIILYEMKVSVGFSKKRKEKSTSSPQVSILRKCIIMLCNVKMHALMSFSRSVQRK